MSGITQEPGFVDRHIGPDVADVEFALSIK
jgi:hypothetical protein